jgi:N-acetyl-anhydromuramyl-L-alanine amidase AmpD
LLIIHHTVGGSARSTFRWWLTDPKPIGTAYIVARNGTIHEVFPPDRWAYHLGYSRRRDEKRSIGIELAVEGALLKRGGELYCFDRVSERTRYRGQVYDLGRTWRGYRYFAAYPAAQIRAVIELIGDLLLRFAIPPVVPRNVRTGVAPRFREQHRLREGVLGHAHVRPDKTDVHPGFPWNRLVNELGLQRI